jgi:hypothetical protein
MKFGLSADSTEVLTIEYNEDRFEEKVVKVKSSITNPEGESQVLTQHIRKNWICR